MPFQPQLRNDCVTAAISFIRTILNYDTAYPVALTKPEPMPISFIVLHAQEFFPNHVVATWCNVSYKEYATNWQGPRVLPEDTDGNYIFMFDYTTLQEFQEVRNQTHTVVGIPSFHRGMFGTFTIRVSLNLHEE